MINYSVNASPEEFSSYRYHYVHLKPAEQIGLHQQSTWELSYVIAGEGMRTLGDLTEPFVAGEVLLIPPGISHVWAFDPQKTDAQGKIENISVSFYPNWLEQSVRVFPELEECVSLIRQIDSAVRFMPAKERRIATLLRKMNHQQEVERLSTWLLVLKELGTREEKAVVGYAEMRSEQQERLRQVEVYVTCNARRLISIEQMAQHVGMNRSSFCTFFKKAYGKTFITYLNEYRIEKAAQLLCETRLPVSEICFRVGFNNVPHFNKVFKRMKQFSPTQWRMRADVPNR